MDQLLKKLNWTVRDLMDKISFNCEDIFEMCKWEGSTVACDKLFVKSLSMEGYCCTFNYFGLVE